MIRRDYIIRMIEEVFAVLNRIRSLKADQKSLEAAALLREELERLFGLPLSSISALSETEIFAKLIASGASSEVREKALFLASFLKEAGDLSEVPQESRGFYLNGLNLILEILGQDEAFEVPEFVPTVDVFLIALGDAELPVATQAMLMRHFERLGQFARAEDFLFSMLDAMPGNKAVRDLGLSFYERLRTEPDVRLEEGNLPRPELESGLATLQKTVV